MTTKISSSVRVRHTPTGGTSVTVTLKQGRVSASWTEKCYRKTIQAAAIEARAAAREALDQMVQALSAYEE